MDSPTSLVDLPVLVLDAQATASATRGGALLEVGWAWVRGREGPAPSPASVSAHVVAPAVDLVLPRQVERLTGLSNAQWRCGLEPAALWAALLVEGRPLPIPTLIHYARFEEPFLRALHARHGSGHFPFDLLCTHAIAQRLLPELPRRTLRALAGYFGAAVPPLRRCAGHVVATSLVWWHLVRLLAEREGIVRVAELRSWLARPARRAPRCFALNRERRRALPTGPGVYRFLRAGGAVLYVGKAASLRTRVASHFHARAPHERSLEMLTQVRDVTCSQTATALEAALLEADEIKRLAPPYNVALVEAGRELCYATNDLDHVQPVPDARHPLGPLAPPAAIEGLAALRAAIVAGERSTCALRARAVGVEPRWAPAADDFGAGLCRFVLEHGRLEAARDVERLGRALWTARRRPGEGERGREDVAVEAPAHERRHSAWDGERVRHALELTVLRATHAIRRARWLLRFSECAVAWSEPGSAQSRLLVIAGGRIVDRESLAAEAPLPTPPGHSRGRGERLHGFDVATFDRLRVLTTELRGLAPHASRLELRLGPHVRLSGRRLQGVLRWI